MSNELQLLFTREAIQKLLQANTDFIVIKTGIEEALLQDGSKAGVVRVRAEAVNRGEKESTVTVVGCPIPPCRTDV